MTKLTEKAVEKIKAILAEQNMPLDKTYVRVGIRGKSCSGTVYSFSLDEEYDTFYDDVISQDGLNLVHNKQFAEDLATIEIDYKETEDKKGFVFDDKNPLKVMSGGCGGGGCGGGGCHS
jgi:iron-sulfur cluster assembly accessory protein